MRQLINIRMCAENERIAWMNSPSGTAQCEHPPDVPAHRYQIPLAFDVLEPTQQELAEAHHRFDDPEHRLGGLLAQGVELFASPGLQPMRHLLHRAGRQWLLERGECRTLCSGSDRATDCDEA